MARVCVIGKNPGRKKSDWSEAVQQYLWYKKANGLKDSTIQGQQDILNILFNRYPYAWQDPKKAVYAFFAEEVKPATYNIRLSYLRSFFNWCIDEGILTVNPTEGFKKRKSEGRVVKLDITILKKLISLPNQKTFAGLRDYALILFTLDTGIRPKEAFSLTQSDFNFRSFEVYVRQEVSKTKVSRTLSILPITAKIIQQLITARHTAWQDNVPVFCSCEGTAMTRHTWNDRLEAYSKELGTKITPYYLRHNFALQFLRNGGNVFALQLAMGHADLKMTKHYLALTQEEDMRQQHALASPLNSILIRKQRVRKLN